MPLAPNVVRLDTHASGLLFADKAGAVTLHRAAELTLQNGYTHFRLEQADISHGSQLAGVYSTSTGNAYGTAYGNSIAVSDSSFGMSTPIYRPTADVGVTVVMFHAGEPGAVGAFDAKHILGQQ
ncbi:MAG TPA: hypothetical protein VGH40_05395 [Roseiarcus sp.]|jgi:hypothetical protein